MGKCSVAVFVLSMAVGWNSTARAINWKIEAERAGAGNIDKVLLGERKDPSWTVEKDPEAGEGAYLSCGAYGFVETHPISTRIPHAGAYRVWVRHYRTEGKFTSFYALFRDDIGAAIEFHNLDFKPRVLTSLPDNPSAPASKESRPVFTWSSFTIAFERPMEVALSFGPSFGVSDGKRGIDCVILSDDLSFDPAKTDWAKLPKDPGPLEAQAAPQGMKPAPVFSVNSAFFAGVTNRRDQLKFALCHAGTHYRDYAWHVQLGANFDHGWNAGSTRYGVGTEVRPDYGYMTRDLAAKIPPPTGRSVNAQGKVGGFSNSYEPYLKAYLEETSAKLANFKDDEDCETFMICGEGSGRFDYGDASKDAFHKWLARRFGEIGKLNEVWRTQHKSFDEIPLPMTPKDSDNKAPWFAFREFCGLEYVNALAAKARLIREQDPKRRPSASQASCLSINSPTFTSTGPMDYEDLVNIAFADEPEFGLDAYSAADSFVGCDLDFVLSLTKGRRLINSEFNVHSHDPRNMSQSYWGMIGKGLKGICTWAVQPTANDWMYHMWGLVNTDGTPRPKLASIADANHEAHRLERILAPATPRAFVKPVALYYSRMDLSLPQPTLGVYSSAMDSPYRIYAILRGLGYPVRWITPRQIEAGELKDVAAVALIGVKYVPGHAATKLAQWVWDGGSLIGDQWPGAFDEYDRQQNTLFDVFGIRPEVPAKPADVSKARQELEQSATPVAGGIDPEILRTLSSEELLKNVEESWDQWDATNAVARAVGPWHLSGFDLKKIKVVSGEIIGMGMGRTGGISGIPAMVVNNHGKGHTLYCASMLGTLYETGPVAFEWDSSREGPALYHILDAFLTWSGVQPFAQTKLPERMTWKLRVEIPQIDPRGNVFIGLTSLNDAPLSSFPLSLRWPASAPKPKMLLVSTGGSRRMEQVPFEIKDGKLTLMMPGFDTHASLLALTDSDPLVALEFSGAPRAVAGLLDVKPNARLKIKATVWNPSPRKLAAGEVKLYAAPGWFCKDGEARIGSIDSYGNREVGFEIAAPAICSDLTLRPIVVKYELGKVTSTPTTEMVWWKPSNR